MSWGKSIRLSRILGSTGRSVVLPVDHGAYMGPIKGIESIWNILEIAIKSGVDSILVNKGVLKLYAEKIAKSSRKVGIVLRVSGMLAGGKEFETLVSSVEEALVLGADGVAFTVYVGGDDYNEAIRLFGMLVDESDYWGIPVVGEFIPSSRIGIALESVKLSARIGAELGADVIKTVFVDPFREVVNTCPVPILIAGGEKMDTLKVLKMVRRAMDEGASGVCIGRNVFQHKNPERVLKAIIEIVRRDAELDKAIEVLRGDQGEL